jgi:lipoprotein-anchoring transpeptidase ErfK/SrfK
MMMRKSSAATACVLLFGLGQTYAIERPNANAYTLAPASTSKAASTAEGTQLAMNANASQQARTGERLKAVIDLAAQEMQIYVDGSQRYSWKISSGRNGYPTPGGSYKPQWLSRMHYSKKFDDAPMPYSVFFKGGYAIHGTTSISRLGSPASHGCVRLHPDNARTFFELVQRHGKSNSSIELVGRAPGVSDYQASDRPATDEIPIAAPSPKKSAGPASISGFGTIPSFF